MKDKNKLILSIVAVLIIGILVVSGTYAYWSWTTSEEQKTSVSFTVNNPSTSGALSASINGNASTSVYSLVPTTCTNATNTIKTTVPLTYKNLTNSSAKITAYLKVTSYKANIGTPTAANLGYLKWALTSTGDNCTGGNVVQSGTFTSLYGATLPLTLLTLEKSVPTGTNETTDTYYLWIWLDSTYEHTNVGNTNSDPMQDLQFTVAWSGTIEQLA